MRHKCPTLAAANAWSRRSSPRTDVPYRRPARRSHPRWTWIVRPHRWSRSSAVSTSFRCCWGYDQERSTIARYHGRHRCVGRGQTPPAVARRSVASRCGFDHAYDCPVRRASTRSAGSRPMSHAWGTPLRFKLPAILQRCVGTERARWPSRCGYRMVGASSSRCRHPSWHPDHQGGQDRWHPNLLPGFRRWQPRAEVVSAFRRGGHGNIRGKAGRV